MTETTLSFVFHMMLHLYHLSTRDLVSEMREIHRLHLIAGSHYGRKQRGPPIFQLWRNRSGTPIRVVSTAITPIDLLQSSSTAKGSTQDRPETDSARITAEVPPISQRMTAQEGGATSTSDAEQIQISLNQKVGHIPPLPQVGKSPKESASNDEANQSFCSSKTLIMSLMGATALAGSAYLLYTNPSCISGITSTLGSLYSGTRRYLGSTVSGLGEMISGADPSVFENDGYLTEN